MSSRKRAGNTGNSTPVEKRTYELRGRKINAPQPSYDSPSVSTITQTNPQTPEPVSEDISGFVRPEIKSTAKDSTVEPSVRSKSTRKAAKPVDPDMDDNSDDGSDYNNSGSSETSEHDRQSYVPPARSSVRQPSPLPTDYSVSFLTRPPISAGVTRKQSSYASQYTGYTRDKAKSQYYKEEAWRDDKEETSYHLKPEATRKDELKEISYKEEKRTLRSTRIQSDRSGTRGGFSDADEEEERTYYQPKRDRGEGSFAYPRHQQKPKENTMTQPNQSRLYVHSSDDDAETVTKKNPYEQMKDFRSGLGGGEKINHYSERNIGQKANIVKKPPTKSFIHCVGTCMKYLVLTLLLFLLGGLAAVFYTSPESVLEMINQGKLKFVAGPQVKKDLTVDFENLTRIFTNQSPIMWNRSRRVLERHLEKWDGNTEPAIILLTGAKDAEQTLLCLGTRLADVYSSSLSGDRIVISGSDWASGSNEKVKEFIDDQLSASFQGSARAAVLNRIEMLPAGSLLILYKYCDHETAVYKNVMLLLTVLLDDPTLDQDMPLTELEEKVRAFLIQKLINSKTKPSHDGMDEDKFSGVWSRISHVVLPVYSEKNVMGQCLKKPN
ncbi:torsin-1A-interacting protein 1-like isoform X2 [Dendropsophus ebraccatus]|uniref:torsin-1A-interacting protein 1-like isoform X2 n=1 Tax=Dendropsophus ebraccatus TaxID=150705 RepID=UPI003831AA7F